MNVGDVTGPRWVGGVTNPDTRDAEVEALRAENIVLRQQLDNVRSVLATPLDTSKVLDTPSGRALWQAVLAQDARALLDEGDN